MRRGLEMQLKKFRRNLNLIETLKGRCVIIIKETFKS